jgi:hypothetical protein
MQSLEHLFHRPPALHTLKLHMQYVAHRLTRHPRLFWHVRDFYRFLSRKRIALATWTSDSLEGRLGPDYERSLAPSLKSRLAAHMLRGELAIARHKRLADQYERGLRTLGLPEPEFKTSAEPVLICYPIQIAGKPRLLQEARKSGVELGDWFSSPVHPLSEHEWKAVAYAKGSCPMAEAVSKRIVTLPCHSGISEREAERTLEFLARMKRQGRLDFAPAAAIERGGEALATAGVPN